MVDYATYSTCELKKLEENYLQYVNQVTGPTGAIIIMCLGAIRDELEKRGVKR
jgi:hypothetical protein